MVAGVPITIYGEGGQTRGYLNINDTIQCVELAINNPANKGELRILNQFTETFSVMQLAKLVKSASESMGMAAKISKIKNPRKEKEDHYYNPVHTGLLDLGLKPTMLSEEIIQGMLEKIIENKTNIDKSKILPRINWNL